MNKLPTKKDLWFLPLGGSGEIGMNLNLFGHDGQWLMVDLGITFNDKNGIDIITPDISFIEDHKDSLVGLVVTHAHEDHIGAIPYLWPYLECPIYATPFTAEIIKKKIADRPWAKKVPIHVMPLQSTFTLGNFEIEYVTLTHSIPEPNALCIKTPLGTLMHTGDWKIDGAPIVGDLTDVKRFKEIGEAGVKALICDSTNVFNEGEAGSEKDVQDNLIDLIKKHPKKRIVVACFASNVARLASVYKAAKESGREVGLVGRSMHRMVETAMDVGHWDTQDKFIDEAQIDALPKERVLLITTGSQGEARAALSRMATQQHPFIKLNAGDLVMFSSRVIPGNEKAISAMQNRLAMLGVELITSYDEEIHVSGHPARDELRQMYDWIKPEMIVPVHGEFRHMQEQAKLASENGISKSIVPMNGDVIQLNADKPHVVQQVEVGRLGVDGSGLVPMDSKILKERTKLSIHGIVHASILATYDGVFEAARFSFLGLVDDPEETTEFTETLNKKIAECNYDYNGNKKSVREDVKMLIRKFFNQNFGKKPIVDVHILQER